MDLYIFDSYEQGSSVMSETKALDCVIIGRDEIENVRGRTFDRIYSMGANKLSEEEYDQLLPCSLNIRQLRDWPEIKEHLHKIGAL